MTMGLGRLPDRCNRRTSRNNHNNRKYKAG